MKRRSRVRHVIGGTALLLVIVAAVTIVIDVRLRPVVESYSRSSTKREAVLAADKAVTLVLEQVDTAELLHIQRDSAGNIQSLETDMTQVNRLKAAVTKKIVEILYGTDIALGIPVGTLTGSDLLTGRGPKIPIRISRNATAVAYLRSSFESEGINQTNHRLWLEVEVTAVCAISGFRQLSVTTQTEYLVSETVLVGLVPETLADVLEFD